MLIDLNAVKNLTNKDHVYLHTIKNVWSQNPGDVTAINVNSLELDNRQKVRIMGMGGNNDVRYIDEAAWNHIVTLRPINTTDQLAISSKDNFRVYTNDTTGVATFSLSNLQGDNNERLPVRIVPLKVGLMEVQVDFLGDAQYAPCSGSFEIQVKKHNAKVTFSSDAATVGFGYDGAQVDASNLPTLNKWMDADGTTATYTVKYSSSDPNVASVDENTGAVTMHNSGVTVISATVVTTKTINDAVVEAYTSSTNSYELTVQGANNQSGTLVWLSQLNPNTGSPQGGKIRGSYWTQKNISEYTVNRNSTETMFNRNKDESDQVNRVTTLPYGNEIIVQASAFNNLDWLNNGTWYDRNTDLIVPYSQHFFKLKNDTYFTGNEEGLKARDDRFNWRYNQIGTTPTNYNGKDDQGNTLVSTAYQQYIPEASWPKTYTFSLRNGTTDTRNNVWMSNIEYSISDPRLLDSYSEGERIQAGGSEGQCWTKEYSIRPYPAMDDDGNVTGDSITIYAKIPGNGNTNPIIISTKVLVVKGTYSLTTEPKEGYVTVGEWVIPYVNIPDIKLKDIKKITVWFDDPDVGKIECEISTNVNGQIIYTLYEKDVTSSEWIHVHKDDDSGLDLVDCIYPKIIGLIANKNTVMHLKVESPYYEDQETEYILHVLPDADHPMFHWYANDTGEKTNKCVMGRDKGVNKPRTIWFGTDDCEIKEMVIYEGDLVHMPGIVGTPNGNDEFSVAGDWNQRTQSNPSPGYKYLYGIKNGKVERNADSYYWREGVPNYFFTTGYTRNGDVYTPQGEPLIPTNQAASNQSAFIIKSIAEWGQRGDTLMIYGNKPGNLYLWAQDPQTHLCCTPIHLTVKAKSELLAEKRNYLQNEMTYPYTWDFEHMDLTNIIKDRNENGSNYWELLRIDEQYDDQGQVIHPDHINYYQANGFFNADYDDKDGNESYRQRWFKDLVTGKDGYMPQFYGLMLNISGLQYWTQKYNRFQVAADGSHIYFVGGPHFLQLPGFGINPVGTYGAEETYSYTKYDYNSAMNQSGNGTTVQGKDGTRYNDNIVGGWHNHINTINNSVAPGYNYVSSNSNINNTSTNYKTNSTYRNRKVRFVIECEGNANSSSGAASSQFHIGGKSMIEQALDENRILWNYNTNDGRRGYNRTTHPGYSQYNIPGKKRSIYVYELDPYDPEFQDHIYIMFNNDVKVYWMAISTEARDLRSDYDNFTYSYPKDIDLDKTNILMKKATKEGVTAKTEMDGIVDKYNDWMVGAEIGVDAYYASKYRRSAESLTLTKVPNNRFAGNEGVIVYPSLKISESFNLNQPGMETISRTNQTAYKWTGDYKYEEVDTKDENGNPIKVKYTYPVCETVTIDKSFQYLPTYFIANAENMDDYDGMNTVAKATNSVPYHKEATSNYAADYEGYGKVPMLNAQEEPMALEPDDTHETKYNGQTNLLRPAVYTTYIRRDYNLNNGVEEDIADANDQNPNYGEGANDNRWVTLGMSNEFIWRNLLFSDVKTLRKSMIDDDGNFHDNDYYYMYGPQYVRFYRTNQDQNMKNRRAYLSLTWDEYNVDTYGKGGVTYDNDDEYPGEVIYVPGATGISGSSESPTPTDVYAPGFMSKAYSVRLRFDNKENDESLVSEDAGIVDGIEEVETVEANDEYVFYNLNGVRVYRPTKGVYILNGKKVIVK